MGREIRRVPFDWEHPKKQVPDYRTGRMVEQFQPLYDRDFESAMANWLKELDEWKTSEFEQVLKEHPAYGYDVNQPYRAFCEYNGCAPDPDYHRPMWSEDIELGYAVYETVSEGTPVTPAFATKEELIDYLATHGTFWDDGKAWGREAAEGFVKAEWSPSLVINTATKQMIKPSDAAMYNLSKAE
jgi:hypothetical protein